IRDFHVTGVQTCALPIFTLEQDSLNAAVDAGSLEATDETPGGCSLYVEFCVLRNGEGAAVTLLRHVVEEFWPDVQLAHTRLDEKIGRASCRERARMQRVE